MSTNITKNRKKAEKSGVLYMQLADDIFQYIQEHSIKEGERLPSERAFAEIFHTSRTSIREAIRVLQNRNILEVQIGNGMFLKNPIPDSAYQIELWKIDYMELLDIKTTLEFHIIEELCEYLSPVDQRLIEEALKQLEDGYVRGIFDQSADNLFHKRIRSCSHNRTLVQMIDNLISKLDEYATEQFELRKAWYDTIPYHRIMFDGIINHKLIQAREAFYRIFEIDKLALENKYGTADVF